MARKSKQIAKVEEYIEPTEVETTEIEQIDEAELEAIAEIEEQIALPRSVVNPKYKVRYRDQARERGDRGKAAKRSKWDWLAQQMAERVLNKKAKLDVDKLLAILDANGVDHSRWTNRAPGWEGRLRMTGCLALRKTLAETGVFQTPEGPVEVPAADMAILVAKYA